MFSLVVFIKVLNKLCAELIHHTLIPCFIKGTHLAVNYPRREKRALPEVQDAIQWTHSQVLDDRGDLILRWQPRHKEILFRVEGRTRGYVGVGFSPHGGMAGADIVLGWVDDRTLKVHLLVRLFVFFSFLFIYLFYLFFS